MSQSPGWAVGKQEKRESQCLLSQRANVTLGGAEIPQTALPPAPSTPPAQGTSYPFSISLQHSVTCTILPADTGYKLISNHSKEEDEGGDGGGESQWMKSWVQ